jgi:hypothetical protein
VLVAKCSYLLVRDEAKATGELFTLRTCNILLSGTIRPLLSRHMVDSGTPSHPTQSVAVRDGAWHTTEGSSELLLSLLALTI